MIRKLAIASLAMLIAGCASTQPSAAPTGGSGSQPTASPAASASAEPIVIGLSSALSGGAADIGQNEKNGAELALGEINAKGGVKGRQLQLKIEDNACEPTGGANSVAKLSADQNVVAIIGALCSSVTLAAMPIVQRDKVPFVVGISSAPSISEKSGVGGNEWTFRINPSDTGLAVGTANYLAQSGKFKKIAILAEDTDYGRGGAAALTAALKDKGLEVTSADIVTKDTQDYSAVVARYQSQKPDAIAIYINGADHLNFVKQASAVQLNIPLTARVELYDPSLEVMLQGAFEGTTSASPYSDIVQTPGNLAFVETYKAKYGTLPTDESYNGYKEVQVLADALGRAASIDRAGVRDALKQTNFPSLLGGTVKFDDHNQAHDNIAIKKIQGGAVVLEGTYGT